MSAKLDLILLVDDDEDDLYFHQRAIRAAGLKCQIDICTSGDIALDYLTNQGEYAVHGAEYKQPDLIFLDINMPRVDGWEFIERYEIWLKSNSRIPTKSVIVMLSTSARRNDIAKAETKEIVRRYVSKPLDTNVIKNIVQDIFPPVL